MASNFWLSTHYKNWISKCTVSDLRKIDPEDAKHLTREEIEKINDHVYSLIRDLAKKLNLRQIVIASATIFYRRFYQKYSFVNFDPRLVAATVMYIAAKTEECQVRVDYIVHTIRLLTTDKNDPMSSFKPIDVLDCEYYVVECLNFDLVLYHPYRPMVLLIEDLKLRDECLKYAWEFCNDVYRTDAIMLYPPFIIAIASVYLAMLQVQRDPSDWLNKLNVDQTQLDQVIKILTDLYETYTFTKKDEIEKILVKLNTVVPQ